MHRKILESDRYPEIVFTPDSVIGKPSAQGASQIQVHGIFRIHGGDHEMTLPFDVKAEAGEVAAATQFSVPYVKWGMKNPGTFVLKVNETVEIGIRAVGRVSGN
jgi:polyisoprenoid-binding protein YceI